jgi:hypothetical protein
VRNSSSSGKVVATEKGKEAMSEINAIPDDALMKATIEGDDLVIRLPLDLLIWSQKQREESITVIDKQKMAEYLANILEFGGDQEIGSTAFEDLIDACFMHALESAEDWLQGWWELEEEDSHV